MNIRGMVYALLALVLVGVGLYVIETYVPMSPPIKIIVRVVVVIFVILSLLSMFGIF